jgi:flagellar protein FlgJ
MATGFEALSRFQSMQGSTLPNVGPGSSKEHLHEAAVEFESLFVKMMLDTMRKNLHKEDRLVETGMGEDIFEDMLYTEYSRKIAKVGDFGIARAIEKQLGPPATPDAKPKV